MSRVSKTSLRNILDNFDLIMMADDIIYFCNDLEVSMEFMRKFSKKDNEAEEVKEFLVKHENIIDKEKLILLLIKNYKDGLKIIEDKMDKVTRQAFTDNKEKRIPELVELRAKCNAQKERLKKIIRFGKGIERILTFYCYDEKQKRYRIEVFDPKEVIDEKTINFSKHLRKFNEVDMFFKNGSDEEGQGLEYVLQSILLTDLANIFITEKFGNEVRTMILENEILKRGIKTRKELESMKNIVTYEEYSSLVDNVYFDGILPDIKSTLREYCAYMDMDKLLLISAYRFIEALENGSIGPQYAVGAKNILTGILQSIKTPNIQIDCRLQRKADESYEYEQIEYSIKDLKRSLLQFTSSEYVTTKEIREYEEKVNNNEIILAQISPEKIDIIFSAEELDELSTLSVENLLYVYQKNNWDEYKIIDLYETGKINLEYIIDIKEIIDLTNAVNFDKLNTYYNQLKEQPENKEILNLYKNYLNLYKEILINNKDKAEIEEISNIAIEKILECFEEKEYKEAVKNYYKEGVITLDTITQWSNENFITELFNEGIISLEDMSRLGKEEKLPYQYLSKLYTNLLNKEDIEYNERLALIKTGFIQQSDIFDLYNRNLIFEEDLRKLAEEGFVRKQEAKLIINSRTLEELEKNSSIILTGLNVLSKKNNDIYFTGRKSNGTEEEMESTGKFIIDPNERERFIRLLKAYKAKTDLNQDSPFYNYEFYVIPDESGTIGLNSVVIAERYYEDKDYKSKFATDNATYFFKYKDLMVLSNLRKSEMTKERKNIVFTANHIIATERREGSWAKSVISSLVKTMMSCDLKEFSKKNQRVIIFQKLKDIYTPQEINDILNLASQIDFGEFIGEVKEPIICAPRRKTSTAKIGNSFDDEAR